MQTELERDADSEIALTRAVTGCLLGTAVGDALGLPYEGLRPHRARRMLGEPERYRFLFGRGLVSDDTEHTCFVLQALKESGGNADQFARCLAQRLRMWILLLPAGVGKATAQACLKLLVGYSPRGSGVFSAGNGPAMRSAILGAAIDDVNRLGPLVAMSARLTHTDPKAEQGAYAVAFAAWTSKQAGAPEPIEFFAQLRQRLPFPDEGEFLREISEVEQSLLSGETTGEYVERRYAGRGVSGYTLHTVPVVLHAWLNAPHDYRTALMTIIRCGGDADTTAAILGGIVGSAVGSDGIPQAWLDNLVEWPRSVNWMRKLAASYNDPSQSNPECSALLVFLRNLAFLMIVLFHGLRRLLPPYA